MTAPPALPLGGLLALSVVAAVDTTAFGQFMIGQPIVTGALAGALAGDPMAGIFVGAALQLLWSRTAPVGAAAYPDVGPATAAGVGSLLFWNSGSELTASSLAAGFHPLPADLTFRSPPAAILTALLIALLAGVAGQRGVSGMRRGNAALAANADRAAAAGDFAGVERANLMGLGRAALLGLAFGAATLAVGAAARLLLGELPGALTSVSPNPGVHLAWWGSLGVGFAALEPSNRADYLALGVGLVAGLLFLLVVR